MTIKIVKAMSNLIVIKLSEFDTCNPFGIYLFKVNNRNTKKRCEICSKLKIKTPEPRPHLAVVFLLLSLNM